MWLYPNWNGDLAEDLLAEFELPANRADQEALAGMRSALGIVVGLAARAEVTLFDEPYAGLDAVARQLFYERLLADYAECPRTVVLSTHLIDEVADLLERVVIIDHGRIVLDAQADDVRGTVTTVSGRMNRRGGVHLRPSYLGPAPSGVTGVGGGRRGAGTHNRTGCGELNLRLDPLSLQQMMVFAADRATEELKERTNA